MSEAVTVKKRGRPKKAVVDEAVVVVDAAPEKSAKSRKKITKGEEEVKSKRAKGTATGKGSKSDATVSTPAKDEKSSSTRGRKKNSKDIDADTDSVKEESAEARSKGSESSPPSKNDNMVETTTPLVNNFDNDATTNFIDTTTSSTSTSLFKDDKRHPKLSEASTDATTNTTPSSIPSRGDESWTEEQPEGELAGPASVVTENKQHAEPISQRLSHRSAAKESVPTDESRQPYTSQPSSKILEALASQKNSAFTPVPSPSSDVPLSYTSGPAFSASTPLNSPSMPQNSKESPKSPPLDLPTGPPNPGQTPLTPDQIQDIRNGPSASTRKRTLRELGASASSTTKSAAPLDAVGPPNPGQVPLTPQQIEAIRSSPQYKAAHAKWTRLLVAAPIAIVTSYVLWDRYRNPKPPVGPLGPSHDPSSSAPSHSSQTPPILGSDPPKRSGAKPRIIPDHELRPSVIIETLKEDVDTKVAEVREKRLLEL